MNAKQRLVSMVILAALVMPVSLLALSEADVIRLEQQLIQKETELLVPEMKSDSLIVELWKFDGVGGWFQGKKKDAIKKEQAAVEQDIKGRLGEIRQLQAEVQKMVFALAYQYEQAGQFRKAIDYYLKVTNQTDEVKFRIGTCYKQLREFEMAIQWYLKMAATDANWLHVADCYRLDGRWRDAFEWLFKILEPFNNTAPELTALQLVRTYDYPGKKHDFPNFNQRVSDIYLAKAVINYQGNLAQARDDYREAVRMIADGKDEKAVSFSLVTRYQQKYRAACDVLDQQKVAADRYYEGLVAEAQQKVDQAERRYRQAQREAEDDYARQLEQARREMDRAEWEYQRLQKEASPSAELIAQARERVRQTRDHYQQLVNRRQWIIDEYLAPFRRRVDEARQEYRDLTMRRAEIIERYVRPYREAADQARRAFELIDNLHQGTYGG